MDRLLAAAAAVLLFASLALGRSFSESMRMKAASGVRLLPAIPLPKAADQLLQKASTVVFHAEYDGSPISIYHIPATSNYYTQTCGNTPYIPGPLLGLDASKPGRPFCPGLKQTGELVIATATDKKGVNRALILAKDVPDSDAFTAAPFPQPHSDVYANVLYYWENGILRFQITWTLALNDLAPPWAIVAYESADGDIRSDKGRFLAWAAEPPGNWNGGIPFTVSIVRGAYFGPEVSGIVGNGGVVGEKDFSGHITYDGTSFTPDFDAAPLDATTYFEADLLRLSYFATVLQEHANDDGRPPASTPMPDGHHESGTYLTAGQLTAKSLFWFVRGVTCSPVVRQAGWPAWAVCGVIVLSTFGADIALARLQDNYAEGQRRSATPPSSPPPLGSGTGPGGYPPIGCNPSDIDWTNPACQQQYAPGKTSGMGGGVPANFMDCGADYMCPAGYSCIGGSCLYVGGAGPIDEP